MIVVKPDKGRHLDEGGRTSVNGLPSPLLVRMHPGATKPFSLADEAALKQRGTTLLADQQRGSIMLALLLNAIYRRFLNAALPGMASQGAR